MEGKLRALLRFADDGTNLDHRAGVTVFAAEQQHAVVRIRIDLANRVFAGRQGLVAGVELKWNVGDQLPATNGLRLGRHGHRTNQN